VNNGADHPSDNGLEHPVAGILGTLRFTHT